MRTHEVPTTTIALDDWDPVDEVADEDTGEGVDEEAHRRQVNDRIDALRDIYIRTGRDEVLERAFQRLVDERDSKIQVRRFAGILLAAHSGAGKTKMLDRFLANHPLLPGYGVTDSNCPAVKIDVPSPVTNKSLGLEVLRALYPLVGKASRASNSVPDRLSDIWFEVRSIAKDAGVWVLIIDEAHDLVKGGPKMLGILQSTLKRWLAHDHRPILILSGTLEVEAIVETREMRRRFIDVTSPPLEETQNAPDLKRTIARYARSNDLELDRSLEGIFGRLIHAGTSQLGWTIDIVIEAIKEALLAKSPVLSLDHFADAYAEIADCEPKDNPFLVDDWMAIDTAMYRRKRVEEEEEPKQKSRKRKETPW